MQVCWLSSLTPVTYLCKLLGIRCVAAFLQLELFRVYTLYYITSGRPRSTATKQRFYQRLTALLAQNLQLRPEDVMVIIACTEADAWSFSAGRIAMLPGQP
ncbi:hypothetical protein BIY27_03315 [Gibbsiella quercinecans]|nr:hypothetical protein BIY27_03315 [Gibbsiella quercinecans]